MMSAENQRLREHLAEQATHVEARIQDGIELGASVWRIALEDVARENRALISQLASTQVPLLEAARMFAEAAATEFNEKGAGGFALARLSDLRDAISRIDEA